MTKPQPFQAMSEQQLTALLAKLKEDVGLQKKFKAAADLDAAVSMAQEAGFDVSKADWLKYQAQKTLELSDEELSAVAAGGFFDDLWNGVKEKWANDAETWVEPWRRLFQ